MASRNENTFSISTEEIESTANTWQRSGDTVDELSFAAMESVAGHGSRALDVVRSAEGPAKSATNSIGTRLTALSSHLRAFKVTTEESDKAAAGLFDLLKPR